MKRVYDSDGDHDIVLLRAENPFALPELLALILEAAVVRGVFHTYAALLCVSRHFYSTTSALITAHFSKARLLSRRELIWHYRGSKLGAPQMAQCHLVDGVVLRRLTQLTQLELDNSCRIGSSEISCLTQLTSLSLDRNERIYNFALKPLTRLTRLSLRHNHCIAFSYSLPSLTALRLCDSRVTNADLLLLATQLRDLDLAWDERILSDTVSRLTALERLGLEGNASIHAYALAPLSATLTSLDISDNRLVDDDCVIRLTALTSLSLADNERITDAALSQMTRLRVLLLDANRCISERALWPLTGLQCLSLNDNRLIKQSVIARLTALQRLVLRDNRTDITLAHLTHLGALRLEYDDFFGRTQCQIIEWFQQQRRQAEGDNEKLQQQQYEFIEHDIKRAVLEWRRRLCYM